jgi:uroporphyrinogen decarboxylase
MNARERVLAALQGVLPDRLPVMETIVDWRVQQALGFRAYFDLVDGLDLDAVSVSQRLYHPDHIPWLSREERTFLDPWGALWRITDEVWPTLLKGPIRAPGDLEGFRPPDPRNDPVLERVREAAARYKGKRALIMVARAVFVSSWNLVGMENLLVAYHSDPAFVDRLSRLVGDYNKELHRLALEAGLDVIVLGDDYAHKTATLMSPEHFRRFILPGFREVVANIRACGGLCIKHSDGNIWAVLDDIVGCGVEGVGPLEPGAGMDLVEVKRRYPKLCVMGNVDVDLLCRGSVEEVRRATRELIDRVSPGGRHILSSGNSITSAVPPENFRVMVETAREFGRY